MGTTESVRDAFTAILESEENPTWTYDEIAARYAYNLPESARVYRSTAEVRSAVTASGSHYWDADAVRHFRGRTDDTLYGGRFWVESRKYVNRFSGDSAPREYMVAWVSGYDGGEILSIERLGNFDSLDKARRACKRLAAAVAAASEG